MNKYSKSSFVLLVIALLTIPLSTIAYQQHEESQQKDRNPDRWLWQLPERVMNSLAVNKDLVIGNIGAGDGYLTFRLARRVGFSDHVYANEIALRELQKIRNRCKKDGMENISTILGTKDDPMLPEGKMDLLLMVNVFHFLENPVLFFENIKSALKKGGRLAIIQWDAEKMLIETPEWDPADAALYAKELMLQAIKNADYELFRTETFLPMKNIYMYAHKLSQNKGHR